MADGTRYFVREASDADLARRFEVWEADTDGNRRIGAYATWEEADADARASYEAAVRAAVRAAERLERLERLDGGERLARLREEWMRQRRRAGLEDA